VVIDEADVRNLSQDWQKGAEKSDLQFPRSPSTPFMIAIGEYSVQFFPIEDQPPGNLFGIKCPFLDEPVDSPLWPGDPRSVQA